MAEEESIVMPSCAIALGEAVVATVVAGHLFPEKNGKELWGGIERGRFPFLGFSEQEGDMILHNPFKFNLRVD
ncbi:MAG: hypothetical protein AB1733_00805 [Thermodesulfobacteriota bacterium]